MMARLTQRFSDLLRGPERCKTVFKSRSELEIDTRRGA